MHLTQPQVVTLFNTLADLDELPDMDIDESRDFQGSIMLRTGKTIRLIDNAGDPFATGEVRE